ncbi:hypothetical protein [Microvirga tunisiensis]|uniref:Uncharacterized protein n=1 Tax=Microvirga tunisiensis TaxID=2108360 RepID=A0A5N7MLN2_9HYPH|nr:hypothetical protein [Microvirga tunisiensis]MPR09538.1 hypothetical protein [Microvirga tunisiensis]MPR27758.1 hypothetical protein [Microvirga tunisiensis]
MNLTQPALLGALAFAALSANPQTAAAIDCPKHKGIYTDTLGSMHTLTFESDEKGTLNLEHGKTKLRYRVAVTFSNGFATEYLSIGKTDKIAASNTPVASSAVLRMNSDFSPYRGGNEAPYLVIPDLPKGLYYDDQVRGLSDYVDMIPGHAWQLSSCRK